MTSGILLMHLNLALLIFLILPSRHLLLQGRLILLFGALSASFVVVDGLSLGDYMRSYTGDLAITSSIWFAACTLCRLRGRDKLSENHKGQMAVCFAALALFLYPATLGLSYLDPYRLGFSPTPLLLAMAAVALWFWWRSNYLALTLVSGATLAFVLGIKDSANYWDYLIDPILAIYCCGYLLARYFRQLQWPRALTTPVLHKRWRQLSMVGPGR